MKPRKCEPEMAFIGQYKGHETMNFSYKITDLSWEKKWGNQSTIEQLEKLQALNQVQLTTSNTINKSQNQIFLSIAMQKVFKIFFSLLGSTSFLKKKKKTTASYPGRNCDSKFRDFLAQMQLKLLRTYWCKKSWRKRLKRLSSLDIQSHIFA